MGVRSAIFGVGLWALAGWPVLAQAAPAVTVRTISQADEPGPVVADQAPEVVIGGRVVMRIRTGAGGLTPDERADAVRRRLGPILTMTDLSPEDVQVVQREAGATASIYVRNRLLITADKNLARANDTSPGLLAEKWAEILREVLPEVQVEVR